MENKEERSRCVTEKNSYLLLGVMGVGSSSVVRSGVLSMELLVLLIFLIGVLGSVSSTMHQQVGKNVMFL